MYFRNFTFDPAWEPFREMERMLDDINQVFAQTRGGAPMLGRTTPPMNVWANENGLVITSEVPGADPESVSISVIGDTLTVHGKRIDRDLAKGKEKDQEGLATSEWSRTFQLPYRVDADRTEARCKDGILSIALHRPEAEKPRKIAVKAA